ncbi:WG repeat-containing protein [Anaerotruncus colihominis]|uniref:WG repeat-containing protein n=1 Tax=Anaerotruncus colihominis TaxID=169435 RepID=UPI00174D0A74|nr:WG repeat-containing protein [Anaerotruncus colihominis]
MKPIIRIFISGFILIYAIAGCSKNPKVIILETDGYINQQNESSSINEKSLENASSQDLQVDTVNAVPFSVAMSATEDLMIVYSENSMKETKFGIANLEGKIVVPIEYDNITYYPDKGYFHILSGTNWKGKYGIANQYGKMILPVEYDFILSLDGSVFTCMKDGLWGAVDQNGKVVASSEYEYISQGKDGLLTLKKENLWGAINQNGETVIPIQYEYLSEFSEGLAVFGQNGLFGYINQNNEIVIEPIYQQAYPFVDGVAAVFPFMELVWITDTEGELHEQPSFTLWGVEYIDITGKKLYSGSQILKDAGVSPFVSLNKYTSSGLWRIFDLSEQAVVKVDINGLYGRSKERKYDLWGSGIFRREQFRNRPVYEAVEWNESIPYKDYTSAELIEFAQNS